MMLFWPTGKPKEYASRFGSSSGIVLAGTPARMRNTVGGVIREGCGDGCCIDINLGQARESASKEAETDAIKKALMTFGNPFALALYDKK